MADVFRYAVFISYSSKDAPFARKLHRALETYGIPATLGAFDLIGGGKKNRIYPVFRDREELSAGQLGDLLEGNLRASAAIVVICSRNAAASPWVQKEIEYFVELGRQDRIFAIIADDAPSLDDAGADATASCFPPAFRGDALADSHALEPIAADARPGKDGFRNAWLKIVAGLIGVSPGQLIDRDRARQRRRAVAVAAASALALLFGAYTTTNVRLALQARDVLQQAQNRPSRLQGALLALDALPPLGTAFPLGWPVHEARELVARGGLDALSELRVDPHGVPTAFDAARGWYVGYGDGTLQRQTDNLRNDLWTASSAITEVSATEGAVAAATDRGELVFLDLTRDAKFSERIETVEPRALAVDSGRSLAIVGLADRRIMEWQPAGTRGGFDQPVRQTSIWREIGFHSQAVTALQLSGTTLISAAADGSVLIWDVEAMGRGPADSRALPQTIMPAETSGELRTGVSALALSPDLRWLAIGRRNGVLQVVDMNDRSSTVVSQRNAMISGAAFSADANLLSVAYDDGVIETWPRARRDAQTLYAHEGSIAGLSFDARGVLGSAGYDATLRGWGLLVTPETARAQRARVCDVLTSDPASGRGSTALIDAPGFARLLTTPEGDTIVQSVRTICARRGLLRLPSR